MSVPEGFHPKLDSINDSAGGRSVSRLIDDDPHEGWPSQEDLDRANRDVKKPDFETARFGRFRPWVGRRAENFLPVSDLISRIQEANLRDSLGIPEAQLPIDPLKPQEQ
jgi:hypothetical protein